ncbi:hypothetical protein AX16_006817 [Volvariella volvacea WC 439]|nr:hypothetical protein AX16_006817 [Volvariella volvacea WC 439]
MGLLDHTRGFLPFLDHVVGFDQSESDYCASTMISKAITDPAEMRVVVCISNLNFVKSWGGASWWSSARSRCGGCSPANRKRVAGCQLGRAFLSLVQFCLFVAAVRLETSVKGKWISTHI